MCTMKNEDWQNTCEVCDNENIQDAATSSGEQDCLAFGEGKSNTDDELGEEFPNGEFEVKNEIRIVLFGKTGAGKSATGNTILGDKKFESLVSGSSITSKCKRGETERDGKKILVVDTPGLFDTGMTNETVTKEIVKCIGMTSPGPHAMVLVLTIGRFTKEEQETVQHFVDNFGEGMLKYMIVLFTRQDDLLKANQTIHQYVTAVPPELKHILQQCGNRYVAFNNDATGSNKEIQVDDFFKMVDCMLTDNGSSCYTNEIYRAAEVTIQRRMKQQKQKLEMEKRREMERIELETQERYEKIMQKETIEKNRLERELTIKQSATKEAKQSETRYKSEIHSLQQQLNEQRDTTDKAEMERKIEHLEQKLKSVEIEIDEKDRESKRLQSELDESSEKLEKARADIETDKKEGTNNNTELGNDGLRAKCRDDVENEKSGALEDLFNGVKKIGSAIVKTGKNIWNFCFGR